MFIGQNEINSSPDFLRFLGLESVSFGDLSAADFLGDVWNSVFKIWDTKKVDLDNYTDHGIQHSLNIIAYFLQFDKLYRWSRYEKMIFAAAALIHDIGMQFNKWAPSAKLRDFESIKELIPLPLEEVRSRHIEFGSKLAFTYIHANQVPPFPPALCKKRTANINAFWHSSIIAFAHSISGGNEFLNELRQSTPTWHTRQDYLGGSWRPRLLGGVLIICDELDGNFTRIPEPDRIWGWDLDARARRHWFSCLFVESTQLMIDELQGNRIEIKWQIPRESSEEEKEQIRILLESMRESKIKAELLRVDKFYDECGEDTYEKKIRVIPISEFEPSLFAFPINEELRAFLKNEVDKKYDLSAKTKTERVLPRDQVATEIRPEAVPHPIDQDVAPLDEALKVWFQKKENREINHFELIGGEHTDTYLNCRTLSSNQNLLRQIAEKVVKYYRRVGIEYVLAVGTSAIPLAVNLAHRLQCGITFTMSRRSPYHKVELEPVLPPNKKVLIVDDVISGGSVAVQVIDLLEKLRMKPTRSWHFAIFRLGKRRYKKDKRLSNRYRSIIKIPEVYYAPSPKKCKLCALSIPLQKETDMR